MAMWDEPNVKIRC